MTISPRLRAVLVLLLLSPAVGAAGVALTNPYDLVLGGGRVIDPETGLDAVRDVAIRGGRIAAISEAPLNGSSEIDVRGRVVAPGFIDIHSHTPTLWGQHLNLLDGVTTQLDLEAGAFPVSAYGAHYAGGAQLNYGASVAHFAVRMLVLEGVDQPYLFHEGQVLAMGGDAWEKPATPAQIEMMRDLLRQGLDAGGLGIGVLLDYMTSAISAAELRMLFEVASERDVPLHVHVRRGNAGDPAGLREVIGLAKETGAPLLVCHITHSGMGAVGDWLARIDAANAAGARIAAETLSYLAGATSISADVFRNRDWQAIFDISYEDVQWTATGEWLTAESWAHYAREQPEGAVNHHYVKEEWLLEALAWPRMIVSTDALPALDRDVLGNPNVAGTFARFLGRYVRELGALSLPDALARVTLYPAQWLQQVAPVFERKGRLQPGADADIVVFDPATIAARATYKEPYLPSSGIEHVFVAGRQVVAGGRRLEGRYPGRKLLSTQP